MTFGPRIRSSLLLADVTSILRHEYVSEVLSHIRYMYVMFFLLFFCRYIWGSVPLRCVPHPREEKRGGGGGSLFFSGLGGEPGFPV